MIRIVREVEYGLIALKALDKAGAAQPVPVRAVCERYHLPFDVTSRVLQKLKREGVVDSVQGAHGGYRLACDLEQVTLLDLLRMIGVQTQVTGCLGHECTCTLVGVCNIIAPMAVLNDRLQAFYETLTLKELLHSTSPRESMIRGQFERASVEA